MTDETTTPVPAGNGAGQSRALTEASGEAPGENGKTTGPTVEVSLTKGPAPDSVAGADPTRCDVLHDAVVRVEAGVGKLLERFDEKLLHDEARTNEIKRLNDELAKHQPDAQWNIARLFVDQMIRHLDEIRRFVQRYKGQGDATAKDFVEALEWLHEDIELALEEHDITAYRPEAGKDPFDGRRHSVMSNPIRTTDSSLSRVIERCVRPGFERDGKVIARAAVRIYRHDETEDRQGVGDRPQNRRSTIGPSSTAHSGETDYPFRRQTDHLCRRPSARQPRRASARFGVHLSALEDACTATGARGKYRHSCWHTLCLRKPTRTIRT